jgi:hypothetical protein
MAENKQEYLTTLDRPEGVTRKQEIFCIALIENNFHKQKAAEAAGVPEKSAGPMASKWLRKDKIRDYITALQAERAAHLFLSENRVLVELMKVYAAALKRNKLFEAMKTMELIGKQLGMFAEPPPRQPEEPPAEDDGFMAALEGSAGELWSEEDIPAGAEAEDEKQNETPQE